VYCLERVFRVVVLGEFGFFVDRVFDEFGFFVDRVSVVLVSEFIFLVTTELSIGVLFVGSGTKTNGRS